MTFSSLTFTTLFFPAVLILYFICTDLRWRNGVLLVASLIFYSWGEPIWVLAMIGSTAINYVAAMLIDRASSPGLRKTALVVGAAASLAVLFYFKYAAFLVNSVTSLFGVSFSIPVLELPIGISFYTFQAVSYTIDVYRDDIYAEKNFFRYALFVSFFPQLVAGPIERSKNLLKQLAIPAKLSFDNLRDGLLLMIWGFFLKVVIADRASIFVDTIYGNPDTYAGWYFIIATLFFALQIYCDFSGYSVIAMGAAKMLGIDLMLNFDAPYFSSSTAEFWRRWHISLSS